MSLSDVKGLEETLIFDDFHSQMIKDQNDLDKNKGIKSTVISPITKTIENLSSSDSGKSSSYNLTLLDCSFDSGIVGVLRDSNDMQLHKCIQQCQRILLALERDHEHFCTVRKRLSKISDRKKKQSNINECFCNCCCEEIDPEDEKTFVKCYKCQKYICRSVKCANWLGEAAQWECEICSISKESMTQTSSWVADQISFFQGKAIYPQRARSEIFIPISDCNESSIHFESVSQIGANSSMITAEQQVRIREYVEKIVANLLGGNLDTIAVNQLSKSENYLPASETPYNSKQESDGLAIHNNGKATQEPVFPNANGPSFIDISEARLRHMIQQIIAETLNMPSLSNTHSVSEIGLDRRRKSVDNMLSTYQQRYRTQHYFKPKIYQDLLATAVLNKIVKKELHRNLGMSESTPDLIHDFRTDGTRSHTDKNFNIENLSTTSESSVQPPSDNSSYTEMKQILDANDGKSFELLKNAGQDSVMSDYMASHMIPLTDLTSKATESEDDYMSVTSSTIADGTWESNWLFKKKKATLGGSVAGSTVGMFVPDPREHVCAQIGDKTADEVSDLSELGSDTDESVDILNSKLDPINDRLINKHLIGGQNSKMVLDELIERSSMISNTLSDSQNNAYTDTCNEHVINASNRNEAINDTVNRRVNQLLPLKVYSSELNSSPTGLEDSNNNSSSSSSSSSSNNNNNNNNNGPLTGSIAEREYKKWYNAVEMPNNPYAPEALKKRITGSQERFIDIPNISPTRELNPPELVIKEKLDIDEIRNRESDFRRYSRDYYINNMCSTSLQASFSKDVSAFECQDMQEPPTTTSSFTKNEGENNLYKAMPAQVLENYISSIDSISHQSSEAREENSTTTSTDSDTIKVYNFKKQETTTLIRDTTETQNNKTTTRKENSKSESCENMLTSTRGSTPTALKFLQPKRKLLDPSQVLSFDENEPPVITSPVEKTVIESEVAQALPSVKALAKAFLMTTSTTHSEKRWLRKVRSLPQGGKKQLLPTVKSLNAPVLSVQLKTDTDITITSDLSSLETDSSSACSEITNTKDLTTQNKPTKNELCTPTPTENSSPVSVRQATLKSNIAFFENLKHK